MFFYTGITPAYGGVISALKIEYGLFPLNISPLAVKDTQANSSITLARQWRELEIVRALYEGSSVELARSDKVIMGDFT